MFDFLLYGFLLFLIGIFGLFLSRNNIIVILMCVELLLLSINFNFIVFSVFLDDILGEVFALFILTVAAAESAIGLAILVVYYRVKGSISALFISNLKG